MALLCISSLQTQEGANDEDDDDDDDDDDDEISNKDCWIDTFDLRNVQLRERKCMRWFMSNNKMTLKDKHDT